MTVTARPSVGSLSHSWPVTLAFRLSAGLYAVVADELFDRHRHTSPRSGFELLVDHDADHVLDRLRNDERFGELFVRAAETVAVTWWKQKRAAIGKVVVHAVLDGDDATVDESEFLLLALERLEAPHFAALQRLARQARALEAKEVGVAGVDVPGIHLQFWVHC